MKNQQQNTVAIYCRLSRDDGGDAESNSIGNQREMLRRYAKENNFFVFSEYVDDRISGTTFERDDFKRMVADIEDGKVGIVLCKDLSRLGRNNAMVAFYTEIFFPDNNIRFICVNDGIDSAKGENEIMGFKSIINEYYARDISKKIRSSFKTMADKGWFIGAHAPYGYRVDPEDKHHLLPDAETMLVVQEMFRMAAEGISPYKITLHLSDKKILNPRAYIAQTTGKYMEAHNKEFPTEWNLSTVCSILRNREYCGHIISQKESTVSFKSKKTIKRKAEDWVVVKNMHTALVDEATFEKVQSFLKVKHRENKSCAENIFAGMLKCQTCGYGLSYTSPRQRVKTGTYMCNLYKQHSRIRSCTSHYISYRNVYDIVLTKIQQLTAFVDENTADLEEFYQAYLREGSEMNSKSKMQELERYRKRERELDTIMKKIVEQNALGTLTDERFAQLSREYEAEQQELAEKIRQLQSVLNKKHDSFMNAGNFLKMLAGYKGVMELTESLLRELIDKIVVWQAEGTGKSRTQKIDIYWKYVGLLPDK